MARLTDAMIDATTEKIMEAQASWLEDILSTLIEKGVAQEAVDIGYHPDNSITVSVNGEQKYKCSVVLKN